ncbi:hypothetical protein [Streptomyces sp. SM11]|uniref:hypothetical protein n=1 Tax=Streptomyces sp. SM11 TaxID=565557 RepID=UPI0011B03E5D|nr:hypothetical protein [Streptomyces sp. SM11]
MSHKQMIAWLDQANSTAVQGVADRLSSAAKEISKIGEELKIRPQIVKWEGDGAESFRTWSADLANSTLRLGEFSQGASQRLGEAADAIALAKAAIPRPTGDPEASLKAAESARNDPDSAELIRKLNGEREAAAAEMRKLSQAYTHSVAQLNKLERPTFPPPPQGIAPDATDRTGSDSEYGGVTRPSGSVPDYRSIDAKPLGQDALSSDSVKPVGSTVLPTALPPVVSEPVNMRIDGTAVLPDTPLAQASATVAPPNGARNDVVLPPISGGGPPVTGQGPLSRTSSDMGRKSPGLVRSPALPTTTGGVSGRSGGRTPHSNGIVGGRPVPQTTGQVPGLPRGTVVGGEGSAAARAPMAHGSGSGAGGGAQNGIVGGRRLASEAGVVGGRGHQSATGGARPFTPGGTGLVRPQSGGDRNGGSMGRAGAQAAQPKAATRRNENGQRRPDYLTEDEETWQQGGRRVTPPVID